MVLANTSEFSASDSKTLLSRASLGDAFEEAWGATLDDDRVEADLGSVSEDELIMQTLEESDQLWTFTMNQSETHPYDVRYTIHRVENGNGHVVISGEIADDMEDTLACVRENRGEDAEMVSYALDDLEFQLSSIRDD